LAVSLQLLVVQTLLAHKVLAQSEPAVHALPPAQRAQPDTPPQSVSDSAPFLIRSLQAGALHSREPAGHTPLTQSPTTVQLLPSVHLGQVPPPQLRSVSAPFCAESLHVGTWHTLPVHTPLAQSEAAEHAFELAHLGQVPPPQLMSVSLPFLAPSMQVGTWHVFCGLPEQTLLRQSPATAHFLASVHLAQEPPQFRSVSSPFCRPSLHAAFWQNPLVHTPARQSLPMPQALPAAHLVLHEPPQSTSVSLPFLTTSVHSAAAQWLAVQTPLLQSDGALQPWVSAHLAHVPPPQLTSVSLPFWTVSEQLGTWHVTLQTRLVQSEAVLHSAALGQRSQVVSPPQSTSASPPFLFTSEQLGT
jgi:hypothetical protein